MVTHASPPKMERMNAANIANRQAAKFPMPINPPIIWRQEQAAAQCVGDGPKPFESIKRIAKQSIPGAKITKPFDNTWLKQGISAVQVDIVLAH